MKTLSEPERLGREYGQGFSDSVRGVEGQLVRDAYQVRQGRRCLRHAVGPGPARRCALGLGCVDRGIECVFVGRIYDRRDTFRPTPLVLPDQVGHLSDGCIPAIPLFRLVSANRDRALGLPLRMDTSRPAAGSMVAMSRTPVAR